MQMDLISLAEAAYPWLIVILSLAGARFVSSAARSRRQFGFTVWILSNCLIGIDFIKTGDYPQALLFLVGYEYYNFRGYFNNQAASCQEVL